MPTADAQMVKLPRTLVGRIDAARGDADRPSFLTALLDEYERQDGHAQSAPQRRKGAVAGRGHAPRRAPETAVKPGACLHPANRRIGDGCAVCGATGLGGKK